MSSWTIIQQSLPMFEKGFVLTLWLSLIGIVGSIIVGLIVSLLQYFKVPILHQIASIYVEVSRNTPLLIQLFFLYYAFPVIGIKLGAELCGIIGLIFLGGSYMAEGFTGGFNGVSKGQLESGKAIGLSGFQLARYIVFPQGFSLSVPAWRPTSFS